MTYAPQNTLSVFLPTTEVFPEDNEQFLNKLTHVYTKIAQFTNAKEIGYYDLVEQVNGKQFFDPANAQRKRTNFRKVFSFDTIGTGATLNIPHGLTGVSIYTRIYGSCLTSTPDYRPIPFVSTAAIANQVSIRVAGANIVITNGGTAPNITSGIAVLEYLYN